MLGAVTLSPATLEPIINEMGAKHGVDPALIKAHIKAESNWDVNASRYEALKGDASWGLMQVMLSTAKAVLNQPNLNTTQLVQPRVNIEAGTSYIAQNLKRYGGVVADAIAAYNAGSARFLPDGYTYVNQPYVDKVWKNYTVYKALGSNIVAEAAIDTAEAVTSEQAIPVYLLLGVGLVGLVLLKRD